MSNQYNVQEVGLRRGSDAPISMTLPSPDTAVAHSAGPKSALQDLPNELLLQSANSSGILVGGLTLVCEG